MELVSVNNISKTLSHKKILENTSFLLNSGEIVGIIGSSGSGKSVFLKILIGFFKADSGKVFIDSSLKNSIGFSFQENSIYENLTIRQNLNYFSKIYNLTSKEMKEQIPFLIESLDLSEWQNVLVKKLSGGTKKRVDIACALLKNPKLVIFDEPLLGLDPERISKFLKLIIDINKKYNTSIIITSHMVKEIFPICSKFFLVKDKKIYLLDKSKLIAKPPK
ncbi:MAG: ABC transporter ATP-binding protein [Nanoarchaeota archaeon]|nr:ABC transporter ATP-binding protein [Nanoarchaeota archaeon]